jgi:hypothetical protein
MSRFYELDPTVDLARVPGISRVLGGMIDSYWSECGSYHAKREGRYTAIFQ